MTRDEAMAAIGRRLSERPVRPGEFLNFIIVGKAIYDGLFEGPGPRRVEAAGGLSHTGQVKVEVDPHMEPDGVFPVVQTWSFRFPTASPSPRPTPDRSE